MELREKLISLQSNNAIADLGEMLKHSHVRISWWGQRLVSVDGYEGSVEINELAKKYLSVSVFTEGVQLNFQERLVCAGLWDRVQKLYEDSDLQLANTFLYKYLVRIKEFRPYCRACAGDPMGIMNETDCTSRKNSLFQFTPQEFSTIWPNVNPNQAPIDKVRGVYIISCSNTVLLYQVSKEMVQSALENQSPLHFSV